MIITHGNKAEEENESPAHTLLIIAITSTFQQLNSWEVLPLDKQGGSPDNKSDMR